MKINAFLALVLPFIASSAMAVAPTVKWTSNALNTKHIGSFNNTPFDASFNDKFTFNVSDAYDLVSGKVSSQMSVSSLGLSDLDFTSVVLSGGGKSYALTQTGTDASTETWSLLNPVLLSRGTYTMTFIGTTTSNAAYSGSLSLVSSVAEPETYSMVLLGIGLVGFSARRRKPANFA